MYSQEDLINGFAQTGIVPNDVVLVHSSYKSLGQVDGGPMTVIDAIGHLAVDGSVFYPTYTIAAWCGGHYFDVNETPSEMGAISEVARTYPGAYRTEHPIHSLSILGSKQYEFENVDSYGVDGPFGMFHEKDALVISIGVGFNDTFTTVHYAEQLSQASYRRLKDFSGIYVDRWGVVGIKTYSMSVRKTLRHITSVEPAYVDLLENKVVKQCQVGDATVSYFRTKEYVEAVMPMVYETPEKFYYEKGSK